MRAGEVALALLLALVVVGLLRSVSDDSFGETALEVSGLSETPFDNPDRSTRIAYDGICDSMDVGSDRSPRGTHGLDVPRVLLCGGSSCGHDNLLKPSGFK